MNIVMSCQDHFSFHPPNVLPASKHVAKI